MALIRRQWTPKEADEWTREDTIAVIISPLIYIMLMLGTALAVMMQWIGFVVLGAGIALLFLLLYVINPKLDAISEGYEAKQKHYMEELERTVKWEE